MNNWGKMLGIENFMHIEGVRLLMENSIETVATSSFDDQNPGTSGLRKKCSVFLQKNYTENFIQSILSNFSLSDSESRSLVVGGDGRYFCREATNLVIKMAAANRFEKIIVCKNGIGSTPAISYLIKKWGAMGAVILTASHNPGGINGDFGIKFNVSSGGGAPETLTKAVFETSKTLSNYKICNNINANIAVIGSQKFKIKHSLDNILDFEVKVINAVDDYIDYMKEIFDFEKIKTFLNSGFNNKPVSILLDGRNGVSGPYLKAIVCDQLRCPESFIKNFTPLEDFGGINIPKVGLHPDPNLTYAEDFVNEMKNGSFEFGAAFDGDADRCMIIGAKGYFVSPSDSVAIIAANAFECIPYFKRKGHLAGVARSMPTSAAVDRVAKVLSTNNKGFSCYEVPTGWKFFCNLMDAGKVDICGEESFGAGSSHLREKDGIWTALAWLSIMAERKMSVKDIVEKHWMKFGRHFYTRFDYEELTSEQGKSLLNQLQAQIDQGLCTEEFVEGNKKWKVALADSFSYKDPIDNSVSTNQGLRIIFSNQDRIILRMSGTGSQGATIRLYLEHFEDDNEKILIDTQKALKELVALALKITKIKELTGRDKPTVIT